jgi:hypothetical protein
MDNDMKILLAILDKILEWRHENMPQAPHAQQAPDYARIIGNIYLQKFVRELDSEMKLHTIKSVKQSARERRLNAIRCKRYRLNRKIELQRQLKR